MKNKSDFGGYLFGLELFFIEYVLILLDFFGFEVDYYLNMDLFGLVVSVFAFYFFSRHVGRKILVHILFVLVSGLFVLSFFNGFLMQYIFVFAFNFIALLLAYVYGPLLKGSKMNFFTDFFMIFLVVYLGLFIFNRFYIVDFLNLNYLFLFLIFWGGLCLFFSGDEEVVLLDVVKADYFIVVVLSLGFGVMLFSYLNILGFAKYFPSIVSTMLIMFTGFYILSEK